MNGIRSLFRLSLAIGLACAFFIGTAGTAAAATLTVGAGQTYATITSAMSAANDGDTILVNTNLQTETGISITKSVTITGLGMTNTILQAQTSRGAAKNSLFNAGTAGKIFTIQNMTMRYASNNSSSSANILIFNAAVTSTVNNCLITQNDDTSTYGGLINLATAGSSLLVTNSIFCTNKACCINQFSAGDAITISGSSFFDNTNTTANGGNGGAFSRYNAGDYLMIANSTFTRNSCSGNGGAIYGRQTVDTTNHYIYNCTIVSNSAGGTGGGIYYYGNNTGVDRLFVNSCIVCSNSGYDVANAYGTIYITNSLITTNLYNNKTLATNGCLVGVNPLLTPLAYNGGTTPTLALQTGSPCIDKGANPLGLPYDQRGAPYPRVYGAAADIGAFEWMPSYRFVSYSTNIFYEWYAHNGTINNDNPMTILLWNDTFTGTNGEDYVASNLVTVANLPGNLTAVITQVNSYTLLVTLNGAATNHTSAYNVSNLSFTFADAAFAQGSAATVTNSATTNLQIQYLDAPVNPVLTWSGSGFTEAPANNGTIAASPNVTITVANDHFAGTNGQNLATNGWFTTANLPTSLTAVVTRVDNFHATVTLAGAKDLPHNAAQNVNNLTFTIASSNVLLSAGNPAVIANGTSPNESIAFINPILNYSGTNFVETVYNDGSIGNTLGLSLAGDFLNGTNGENFVADSKVAVSNVPPGLYAVITCNGPTNLTAALIGKAKQHDFVNSISNLTFVFQTTAFSNSMGNTVTNYAMTNLLVSFLSNAITYYVATNGIETAAGTSWATALATITNAQAKCHAANSDVIFLGPGTFTQPNNTITKSVVIQGSGAGVTIVQGATSRSNAPGSVFNVNGSAGQVASITDMTIQYGYSTAQYRGGGIMTGANNTTCTVARCTLAFNDSGTTINGGAIYAGGGGVSMTVSNCTIATNSGGCSGIYFYNGGAGNTGTVYGCTLNDNTGGTAIGGDMSNVTIRNSTVYHNVSAVGNAGVGLKGGLIINCTVASNLNLYTSGGPWGCGIAAVANALLVQNTLCFSNLWYTGAVQDIYQGGGTLIATNCLLSSGANINGATTNGCIINANPKVSPPANNGGPTPTCALQTGSPCIGAANPATALLYDQRGYKRDSAPDIGAFEYGAHAPYPPGTSILFW